MRPAEAARIPSLDGQDWSLWNCPGLPPDGTVLAGGDIAATLTLDWSDPVWSGIPGPAGYLHTLARGRSALRLDCLASNGRLRAYYEAAGFVHCGNVMAAGPPASG